MSGRQGGWVSPVLDHRRPWRPEPPPTEKYSEQSCLRIPGPYLPHSHSASRILQGFLSLLPERFLEDLFDHSRLHFTGLVVKWFAACVQDEDMMDVALVVLHDQFLLLGGAPNLEIDDHKVYLGAVFVVEPHRPPCLSL